MVVKLGETEVLKRKVPEEVQYLVDTLGAVAQVFQVAPEVSMGHELKPQSVGMRKSYLWPFGSVNVPEAAPL